MDEDFMMQMLKSQQEQIAALTAMVASLTRGAPMAQPQPIPQTPQAAPVLDNRMKVRELVDIFIGVKRDTVQPTTLSCYIGHLTKSKIGKSFLDLFVDELTHSTMQRAIDNAPAGRGVRDNINTIKTMIKFARARNICATPPQDTDTFDYKKGAVRNPHDEIAEDVAQKIIELSLRDFHESAAARAVYLGLSCGLRIGEVCGLKWSDYNEQEKTLNICRAVKRANYADGGKVYVGNTKTEAGTRIIPVADELAQLLAEHEGEARYICAGKMVERKLREGTPCKREFPEVRTLRESVATWVRKNELPHFHFHSLRHTFVSQKIRSGVSAKSVAKYVGHEDIKMTIGVYTHTNADDLKKVVG